jgi:hypothetical protein
MAKVKTTKTKSPPGTRKRPDYKRKTRTRAPRTETQRNMQSAAEYQRKAQIQAEAISNHQTISKAAAQTRVAHNKTILRRRTENERSSEQKVRREQIHKLRMESQTHGAGLQQQAVQSRRNYAQTQSVAEAIPTRTGSAFSSPDVSLAGGFAKMAMVTIGLIVLYALVTHSNNTSTAVGRIGGVLAYLSSSTPMFQTGSGGTSSGSNSGTTGPGGSGTAGTYTGAIYTPKSSGGGTLQ